VEIARHWRLQKQRYRLEGIKKTDADDNERISISGNSWVDIPPNGHSNEKLPMENVVYEAPSLEGNNGGNGHNHKSINVTLPSEAVPVTG